MGAETRGSKAKPTAVRVLGAVGVVLLLSTAFFHLTGYSEVVRNVDAAGFDGFWQQAFKATWVFFSVQLLAAAAVIGFYVVRLQPATAHVLWTCTVLLGVNVAVLIVYLGLFSGALLLALATAAVAAAAALAPQPLP